VFVICEHVFETGIMLALSWLTEDILIVLTDQNRLFRKIYIKLRLMLATLWTSMSDLYDKGTDICLILPLFTCTDMPLRDCSWPHSVGTVFLLSVSESSVYYLFLLLTDAVAAKIWGCDTNASSISSCRSWWDRVSTRLHTQLTVYSCSSLFIPVALMLAICGLNDGVIQVFSNILM